MEVVGFSVVDAVNNRYLFDLNPGDELDMDQLEIEYGVTGFTIVCNTTGPVESTFMTDPYEDTMNVEANPPWTLAGDDEQGNFATTPFRENTGEWEVTCQPFCGPVDGATGENTGEAGETTSIDFTVTACTECSTECIRITGEYHRNRRPLTIMYHYSYIRA